MRVSPKIIVAALVSASSAVQSQVTTPPAAPQEPVRAVLPPTRPIPPERDSRDVTKFSFIAYGDTRGRRDGVDLQYEHSLVVESMQRTITQMANSAYPVRFVLQSGDAVVNGRNAREWNRSYVDLINKITSQSGVPYFLAAGNHDVTGSADLNSAGRREGLGNYLAAMAQLIPPDGATRRLAGYPTYAFGYGNTFVLAIDSNIADDSTQFDWISAQLRGLDRRRYTNVIAMFHHPLYSSGPHGGAIIERPTAQMRARYAPLFRQHHVKLLVTGHEHLYEHWIERYRDADGRWRRIDQLVTGGGGAPLYAFQGMPDLAAYRRAAPAQDSVRVQQIVKPGIERGDNPYHYLLIRVDGERLQIDVIGIDWGAGFSPYRTNRAVLADTTSSR